MISLSDDFMASTTGYIAEIGSDAIPLMALCIGLGLGLWIIGRIIGTAIGKHLTGGW